MNEKSPPPSQLVFWGCFIALITTAFGFITRMFMLDDAAITETLLGLDPAQVGEYKGIQVWPFAVSIILFSLIIDKVGYKFSMIFAFVCQFTWAVMGYVALTSADTNPELAKSLIYWGGLVLALGNGTVEAFINPVVATMFDREKTKWLNILHAGWPGGLVIAGVLTILLGDIAWEYKLLTIAIPSLLYFVLLIGCQFPAQERVAAGVTYKEMLSEFGILGAAVVGFLLALQLIQSFPDVNQYLWWGLSAAFVVGFGIFTQSLGRALMFVLILIMMPLATTEIGTDGWISGIMEQAVTFHAGWILVYTSAIMMVLRFFAGPIVKALSPLGLLILSCLLAIAGLMALSGAKGVGIIFAAATLYALGKTFFWPTMLGIVSEQTPKGGALTLNAISGIGMMAVGVLGFPYIGALQANKAITEVAQMEQVSSVPGLVEDGKLSDAALEDKSIYGIIKYKNLDDAKVGDLIQGADLAETQVAEIESGIKTAKAEGGQKALFNMAVFPGFMLLCYLGLWVYFKSKGGYTAVHIGAEHDLTHPSHGEGGGVDHDVTAEEAIADGAEGAQR